MKAQNLFLIAGLIIAQSTMANAPFKDMAGSVPLKFEKNCASDLIKDGKILQPDDACALFTKSEEAFKKDGSTNPSLRFDLSTLEPDPKTTILSSSSQNWLWLPGGDPGADILGYKPPQDAGFYDDLKAMDIKDDGDTLDYVSEMARPLGKFAFVAQKRNAKGQLKLFQLRLDLKGHNLLLRKTLLRKIGYQIPFMDRLKTVKIHFESSFDKFDFIEKLHNYTFVEPSRWIIAGETTEDNELTLQDVIVFDGANDATYNIARGTLTSSQIQGRRALNSLLVPFSLSDATESLNVMDWSMGCEEFNDQLYLNYEFDEEFTPAYEDARWITRKMLKLSRLDWQQAVASAKMPPEASALLTEKLLSRRNCLRERLNLAKDKGHIDAYNETSVALPVNHTVSSGDRLKNGKLIGGKDWPGYARDFSGIDPDSPQSKSELLGYGNSLVIRELILNAVSKFNENLPQTDLPYKAFDRDLDLSVWQFGEFLKTQEIPSIPRKIWSTNFYKLFAYPDRVLIAGNYLGAENQIQMADTLTLGVNLGKHFRGEGLPARMSLSGDAKLSYVKTWVHLKPLTSMQGSASKNFRNIMVPYYEHRAKLPLVELLSMEKSQKSLQEEYQKAKTDEDKKPILEKIKTWTETFKAKVNDFNALFGPNESVMVTTSMGPDVSVMLSKGISEISSIYAKARLQLVDLARLHIFRKGSDKIQIYFDPTMYRDISFALGFDVKRIPIISLNWDFKKGATTTYFFEFDIDPTVNSESKFEKSGILKNEKYFKHILSLVAALKGAKLKYFEKAQKPMVIEHQFNDSNFGYNFFQHRYDNKGTTDKLKIKTTDNLTREYVRHSSAQRKGVDYQSLLVNIAGSLLREKYPTLQLDVANSGNPADTIGGSAVSTVASIESEITPHGLRKDNLLANIKFTWKGWSINKAGAEKTFDEIRARFGRDLFHKPELTTTQKVQFYNLSVNISLYQEAVNRILSLTEKELIDLFAEHGAEKVYLAHFDNPDGWAAQVNNDLRRVRKNWKSDPATAAKYLTDTVTELQSLLSFEGFTKACGGIQNIFAKGSFDGFRVGDEKGRHVLESSTLGQIGSHEPAGPLATILNVTGITSGEMFISWLLSPL